MTTISAKKLIIDCDPGTDDAQAILMALSHPNLVDLIAITTVMGNSTITNTTRNALRILKFANRLDIPVYQGCSSSLIGGPSPNDAFHGHDGLGDVKVAGVDPVDTSLVQSESAAIALTRLVNKYPGEITLVAIGPLTNVAAALIIDEEFGKKLKDCVIMGGSLTGLGNITRTAEFNIYCDPEAAHRVLQTLGRTLTLLPLDTCITHYLPWELYDEMAGRRCRTAEFLRDIDLHIVKFMRVKNLDTGRVDRYCAWDQLAVAVVLRPDCVLEERLDTMTVELSGSLTRGQIVLGQKKSKDSFVGVTDNVRVVMKLDDKIYQQLLSETFSHEFSP